jgi:hypothetical protein
MQLRKKVLVNINAHIQDVITDDETLDIWEENSYGIARDYQPFDYAEEVAKINSRYEEVCALACEILYGEGNYWESQ